MAFFKCKMCGGSLQVVPGMDVCECEFCGTKQTLPRLNSDRKVSMYDRASHFRKNNDFDKAMSMYEQILNEDDTDAEAYWSIVLCRYGIEYVEDPVTHERIPTVNRAQYTSIFADEDYKSAIQHASLEQKAIYEKEARAIDEIQKGILAISQKEKPFDVFICYKETDAQGNRTKDSVIANDLYHQLIREGFKVFFAAITLEDKLGQAYEPYIFAALNSAKVMIVLGTRPEYFAAPWVKNEWSRYLSIIKSDPAKILIPAYRDMDPYDLPDEFSFLQAQDMSKIGFMNDIIHGIKKVIGDSSNAATSYSPGNPTEIVHAISGLESLVERASFFLEEGNWTNAIVYCDKAIDSDNKNAEAYVCRLMAEEKLKKREDISKCNAYILRNPNWQNAMRWSDEALKNELLNYKAEILKRSYEHLVSKVNYISSEEDAQKFAEGFDIIQEYNDATAYRNWCLERARYYRSEKKYSQAVELLETRMEANYRKAYDIFRELGEFRDAPALAQKCIDEENEIIKNDKLCAICRNSKGSKPFIPANSKILCCDSCFSRLILIQQNYGQQSSLVKKTYEYLKHSMSLMLRQEAVQRVAEILDKYDKSVSKEPAALTDAEMNRRKIAEQEKKRKEEREREEQAEKAIQEVLAQNANYEYDVQVVMDVASGGADIEMIKYVIAKYSKEGWKLHTTAFSGNANVLGQTVLIFERRIKREQ